MLTFRDLMSDENVMGLDYWEWSEDWDKFFIDWAKTNSHLYEVQLNLHRRCNIIDAKHHIICANAQLHFVSASGMMLPVNVQTMYSLSFVMMLCPCGHK